jgi:hypothetical protein
MSAPNRTAIFEKIYALDTRQQWTVLCKEAATEHDPAKLLEIVQTINELLDERAEFQMEILMAAKSTQQN